MSKISYRVFGGMRPARVPELLAHGEADQATNTKLTNGNLQPFLGLASVIALSSGSPIRSIYRFGQSVQSETQFWFQSNNDVDYVKGMVDSDTEERTYYTGDGYPKKTKAGIATSATPYPTTSYKMGIPRPASALTASVSGSPTDPDDPAETVTYVVTYVSTWGEEGGPGPAATTVSWRPGQTLNLTSIPGAPAGNYTISTKRIYRSAAGSASTKFQFLVELPLATSSYADTTITANLGDVLETDGWDEPDDSMIGLTAMANGMLAGFFGNTVCFSVPFVPYAWPIRYRQSVDAPIVGIAAFDQSLFVGTTQGIYIFTGSDPASISSEKLAAPQSCVSKRSIVEMAGGVIFAAPDGLMLVSTGMREPRNLTEGLMQREEWQAYKPSSMDGYEVDNRYLVFFDTGARQGGLIFTFGSEATFVETDVYATAGYRDRAGDKLFLVAANVVNKWDAGSALTFLWRSNVTRFPAEQMFNCARVEAVAYPVTFKLYAGNTSVLLHTQTVTSGYAFRLPAGTRYRRFMVEVSGTATVRVVEIATSMRELGLDG